MDTSNVPIESKPVHQMSNLVREPSKSTPIKMPPPAPGGKLSNTPIPSGVTRDLVHVEQKSDWDCGISAVAMCLSAEQRQQLFANLQYFQCNEKRGFGKSTWTIDLSYLLAYFGIQHEYYTTCIGVNQNYQNDGYYTEFLNKDSARVQRLFDESNENGLTIKQAILSLEDLLQFLISGPIIVLVNAYKLDCKDCASTDIWKDFCGSFCSSGIDDTGSDIYEGHYIVLLGFDMTQSVVYYRNPGRSERICCCSFETLDAARNSFGTDNDVIVISATHNQQPQDSSPS